MDGINWLFGRVAGHDRQHDRASADRYSAGPFGSRIAGWEPVDLAMGLRWLQAIIYEGFLVAHRVVADDSEGAVWFKRWEFSDPEPAWPDGVV